MSKTALAADTVNYFAASVASGALAGIAWLSTVSELVKIGAGLAAMGTFLITAYKFYKEQKTKK